MGLNEDIALNLPWKIQAALASGYAAYLLGYRGIRAAHKTIDTAFATLVYGLVATSIIVLLEGRDAIVVIPASFVATCAVALLWRVYFSGWLQSILHRLDISWSDDEPSAFASLLKNTRFYVTQIAVELDDGTWLRCDNAKQFADAPFGPLVLGPNGDVAIYLTHEDKSGCAPKELSSVRDPEFGDRITYIPAGRIRQVTIRHLRRTSNRSSKAAASHSDSGSALP